MRGPVGLRTQYVTRVRLGFASGKTTNLSSAAPTLVSAKKRYFDPRSRKGASGRGPFFAPLGRGSRSGSAVSTLLFCWGSVMGRSPSCPILTSLSANALSACRLGGGIVALGLIVSVFGCGASPKSEAGRATLKYWEALAACLDQTANLEKSNTAAAVTALGNTAQRIRSLPTRGVDVEAVRFGIELSNWYHDAASHRSAVDSPELLVESFIRGLGGDPFGTYNDAQNSESALVVRFRALAQKSVAVRATLTARYDYEFPQF